ncbi:MAG: hypothetical protein ERJ67_09035 [Aphanocapsa feldmannii 277cV]|uniref:Uncharacterized protein n=2 Tax=Aphanocapsa feldmannii TaxID=192050 RepID=A0A524RLB0_9CHRO|nr:MAG: hypothetical protein ERJ69_07590 [Aphanocapsa feldmannii 288cV]TGG90860.1 MAG: hypothetical protein ERJ67_09035 [Aphanocapsa feldmannii 277cV]TGH27072.1 MAG: hypothetical protein ERJ68_01510 [Aphanocapsa feldmannii 277cI]
MDLGERPFAGLARIALDEWHESMACCSTDSRSQARAVTNCRSVQHCSMSSESVLERVQRMIAAAATRVEG